MIQGKGKGKGSRGSGSGQMLGEDYLVVHGRSRAFLPQGS